MSKSEDAAVLNGTCLCGAVVYEVADAFAYAMNCHCSKCRRVTGAAFKPIGGIESGKFRVVKGEDNLLAFGGENYDLHCRTCGSPLYSVVREGKYIHVLLGTLLEAPSLRPTEHIYVGSKASWFEITDDLPQRQELE